MENADKHLKASTKAVADLEKGLISTPPGSVCFALLDNVRFERG